jgi:hypothetical protein
MILDEIKQLKTGGRELRKFGLLVGGVLAVLGVLMWVRGKPHFPWLLGPGIILVAGGLIFPRSLKCVYLAWMSLAIVLGFMVSNVLLTFLFLLVITPIGLTACLFRKDFLQLQIRREAPTYWIRRQRAAQPKSDYERQF